jgi:Na+-transporting NADH:ubiquinone oxidoreductase subunit C
MLNKESNSYIFIFSAVLVVAVGVILTIANESTKPAYLSSLTKEKKQSILLAATGESAETLTRDVADARFDEEIVEMYAYTEDGTKKKEGEEVFSIDLAAEQKKKGSDAASALYPVYKHVKDGKTRYVIAMQGVGLWGPIWGFLAVESDLQTVANAVFDHKSETPGLGAEINTEGFQKQFRSAGETRKLIAALGGTETYLHVEKPGKVAPTSDEYTYVIEGISGGTITSNGVSDMLGKFLRAFVNFAQKNIMTPKTSETVTADSLAPDSLQSSVDSLNQLTVVP